MKDIFIGDIHGSYVGLKRLLAECNYQSQDQLWFVGDLVNRGSQSLEVIDYVKGLGQKANLVLGNHDVHLMAVYYGVRELGARDSFVDVLNSQHIKQHIEWLCTQNFAIHDEELNLLLVHAGVYPSWDVSATVDMANELSDTIRQNVNPVLLFAELFGNKPKYWSTELEEIKRLRCSLNILTRMRFIYWHKQKNRWCLDFRIKGEVNHLVGNYNQKLYRIYPWFNKTQILNTNIMFGHWSALGYYQSNNIYGIDGGYLWGGNLNALVVRNKDLKSAKRIYIDA